MGHLLVMRLKIGLIIYLRMGLFIKGSGRDRSDMAGEFKTGLMVLGMKGSGGITKLRAKASSGTLTETFLTVNGKTIKQMGMGHTRT